MILLPCSRRPTTTLPRNADYRPFILQIANQAEEGDADTSVTVYGWGVEKGKPLDFGYEIISTSAHSCYFYHQQDTSTQAAICFKSKGLMQTDSSRKHWLTVWLM